MLPCAVQNFPPLVAGPRRRFRAGVCRVVALRIHDRELAPGFLPALAGVAGIGIAVEDRLDDRVRLHPRAQQRERLRPVADVDDRLRRRDADARLAPQHAVADGEHARLHGRAQLAGRGVVAENGKGAGTERVRLLAAQRCDGRSEKEQDESGD